MSRQSSWIAAAYACKYCSSEWMLSLSAAALLTFCLQCQNATLQHAHLPALNRLPAHSPARHLLRPAPSTYAALNAGIVLQWSGTTVLMTLSRPQSLTGVHSLCMQIGHILFTGSIAWQPGPGAQMMVPIVFAMLCLALAVALLAAYLTMQWWYQRQACYAALPLTAPEPLQLVEMSPEPLGMSFGGDDSANEQSDGTHSFLRTIVCFQSQRNHAVVALEMLWYAAVLVLYIGACRVLLCARTQ